MLQKLETQYAYIYEKSLKKSIWMRLHLWKLIEIHKNMQNIPNSCRVLPSKLKSKMFVSFYVVFAFCSQFYSIQKIFIVKFRIFSCIFYSIASFSYPSKIPALQSPTGKLKGRITT